MAVVVLRAELLAFDCGGGSRRKADADFYQSSQEESGDDIERQTISIKVDQSRDVTQ